MVPGKVDSCALSRVTCLVDQTLADRAFTLGTKPGAKERLRPSKVFGDA